MNTVVWAAAGETKTEALRRDTNLRINNITWEKRDGPEISEISPTISWMHPVAGTGSRGKPPKERYGKSLINRGDALSLFFDAISPGRRLAKLV
jgi:hypothetical protein